MRHHLLSALALALTFGGLCAFEAKAEQFTLFIYEAPSDLALRNDTSAGGQAYWQAYNKFAASLQKVGALRGGTALETKAGILTIAAGKVSKASYLPSDKPLGGYFIIEAKDMAAAEALAGLAPAALNGAVEIRQSAANPTMSK